MMIASDVGQSFNLVGFKPSINKAYRKKLLSFGFTPGIDFTIIRVAPMGDPIEVKLRGFSVTLRKDELDGLIAVINTNCENCQTCH
jgi:ferrous iron transport protein A